MPVYQLRNGLSIDLTFDPPTVLTPGPAKTDFKPKALYDSFLDAHPLPIDANGNTIPQTNVIKMRAAGTLSGASADVFSKCSLRFIQLIKVQSFDVAYYGKHKDEGSVMWEWAGQLKQRNIDCWVSEDGSQDSSPFQFREALSTQHIPPNTLVGTLGDTPGASVPLSEFNKQTQHDNYLWLFNDRRSFESIITFVHPDGSRQMLESVKWRFTRGVALKWVQLHPEFDSNQIIFTADPTSTSVFGKDADYAEPLGSGRIANRLTNDAMKHVQSSPNISYLPIEQPSILPPDRFWSP
jgi:hypothetical protein